MSILGVVMRSQYSFGCTCDYPMVLSCMFEFNESFVMILSQIAQDEEWEKASCMEGCVWSLF